MIFTTIAHTKGAVKKQLQKERTEISKIVEISVLL